MEAWTLSASGKPSSVGSNSSVCRRSSGRKLRDGEAEKPVADMMAAMSEIWLVVPDIFSI
jgi:hypothetical protein